MEAGGHSSHRLARWLRRGLHVSGFVLLLSGAGWLAVHYSVGAGAGELPHALEPWAMRLHGLAAQAAVFVLGAVAAAHVPHGWRSTRRHRRWGQRRTGVALCALAGLLAFSGWLLYYFAPEWLRPGLGWAHAGAGTAMAALLRWHWRGVGRHPHPHPHSHSHPHLGRRER